jgi:hypothetical protein
MRPSNTRVQRTRSSPSALREPLTRRGLGRPSSSWLWLVVVTVGIPLLGLACHNRGSETVAVGDHLPANVVLFFKKDADPLAVSDFVNKVLLGSRDSQGNYRSDLRSVLAVTEHGYKGYALVFQQETTPATRAEIQQRIAASPVVYRVFQDREPRSIRSDELE